MGGASKCFVGRVTYGAQSVGKVCLWSYKRQYIKAGNKTEPSGNKEKSNRATQQNTIQLLGQKGSRTHFPRVARARGGYKRFVFKEH